MIAVTLPAWAEKRVQNVLATRLHVNSLNSKRRVVLNALRALADVVNRVTNGCG